MKEFLKGAAVTFGALFCTQAMADLPAPVPSNTQTITNVQSVRWTGDSLWVTGGGKSASVFAREADDAGKRAMALGCLTTALYAKSAGLSFIVKEEADRRSGNSVSPGSGTWYCEAK